MIALHVARKNLLTRSMRGEREAAGMGATPEKIE
jgi:hypothetical protein